NHAIRADGAATTRAVHPRGYIGMPVARLDEQPGPPLAGVIWIQVVRAISVVSVVHAVFDGTARFDNGRGSAQGRADGLPRALRFRLRRSLQPGSAAWPCRGRAAA